MSNNIFNSKLLNTKVKTEDITNKEKWLNRKLLRVEEQERILR